MDSRHESLEQETLNELIDLINVYLRDNIDDVLTDERLNHDIREVAQYIYEYARYPINLGSMLSRKNLLSIDVVPLPKIDELIIPDIDLISRPGFGAMLDGIRSVVVDHYPEAVCDQQFHEKVRGILSK